MQAASHVCDYVLLIDYLALASEVNNKHVQADRDRGMYGVALSE